MPSATEQLKQLNLKRGTIKGQLTRFDTYLASYDTNDGVSNLRQRIEKIQPLWDHFETCQLEIETIEGVSQDKERDDFEAQYFDVLGRAQDIINEFTRNQNPIMDTPPQSNVSLNTNKNSANISLPDIKLPKFTGEYVDYIQFHDAFMSIIDKNGSLPPFQKLNYLKMSLEGQAADVIASLKVTDDNYAIAWQLLHENFQNKRAIMNQHYRILFDLPVICKGTSDALRQLSNSIRKEVTCLRSLVGTVDDNVLLYLLTSKLDTSSKIAWEGFIEKNDDPMYLPSLDEFIKFLKSRCNVFENACPNSNSQAASASNRNTQSNSVGKYAQSNTAKNIKQSTKQVENKSYTHLAANKYKCNFCSEQHFIYKCSKLLALPVSDRLKEVKRLILCTNCLRTNHTNQNCAASGCKVCNKKHNTLLHRDDKPNENESVGLSNNEAQAAKQESFTVLNTSCGQINATVLLSTAIIHIFDRNNKPVRCRCLLDSGSQSNFITSDLANRLGLRSVRVDVPIVGINESTTNIGRSVMAKIKSLHNGFSRELPFLVLDKITGFLPVQSIPVSLVSIPDNIKLADPKFNESRNIDLLLGAATFFELLCIGQIKLGTNQPVLQKSQFGWIVSGPVPNSGNSVSCFFSSNVNLVSSRDDSLSNQIESFWNIEEGYESIVKYSKDEQFCEQHFVNTFGRERSGRFIVSLPLKENFRDLGSTLDAATKRFLHIEKKIHRDTAFGNLYINFMREYESLNHMTKVPESQISSDDVTYYLPHHGVLKESSVSTKLRVVFDASAKDSRGLSLNNVCYVGPVIQHDLFEILIRFRQHNVVLKADITKMYRQVNVAPSQRDLQRIVWRENPAQELQHFVLNTVTYGTAPASFLAIRCLHQAAIDNQNEYPEACRIIMSDFYVDDLISGSDSVENANRLKAQISKILESSGFPLTQWMSNEKGILTSNEENNAENYLISDKQTIKTLGILWDPVLDNFKYTVNVELKGRKLTKRTMLSMIAQIFDPLGLISPVVIRAKLFMQTLWKLKLNWDESVPQDMFREFAQFIVSLNDLNEIQTPRHVILRNYSYVQLHGFADASERAYGAAIYLRSSNESGTHQTYLLCSKSRVAPLKIISLPRLELCAALTLSRLVAKVLRAIRITLKNVILWSDSTIVLSWLSREPGHWKTFVSNRVSEIQNLTSSYEWRHVRTADNPADLVSRGCDAHTLSRRELWWRGPAWLQQNSDRWPNLVVEESFPDEIREIKSQTSLVHVNTEHIQGISYIVPRFSKLAKLQNVVAYCIRFVTNCRTSKVNRRLGALTTNEVDNAIKILVKSVQSECFAFDLASLKGSKPVPKGSKITSLDPFIDSEGLLRVGGRLLNSNLEYNHKFPLLLPRDHKFTRLLILLEHDRTYHGGVQTVLAAVRTKFWPLNAKNFIRKIIRGCVRCFKARPIQNSPKMGNLPQARIVPSRPFITCGIDFAGPFLVKDGTLRCRKFVKTYVCLFICFSTKAVHIELCGDLSAEAFLNALKRFVARRGLAKEIYTDNGTNFLGAKNKLSEIFKKVAGLSDDTTIRNYLLENRVNWHLIPPRAPNFGGLWESAIKSMKTHLIRVVGESRLTYEGLYTVLTGVEAILNSRPISPMSNDPNDLNPITPGHFLIGDRMLAIPEEDSKGQLRNRASQYLQIQHYLQHLWRRWSKEYLNTLQQRNKWRTEQPNTIVGSLVLIRDDNVPSLCWRVGRILEVFPGSDNVNRVASVKTTTGVVRRAINKLCVLPVEGNVRDT